MRVVLVVLLLTMHCGTARAVTPCLPPPCSTHDKSECLEDSTFVMDGFMVELRYRSISYPSVFPGGGLSYSTVPVELVFEPGNVAKGEIPEGPVRLSFARCSKRPDLSHMSPIRVRIYGRASADSEGEITGFTLLAE